MANIRMNELYMNTETLQKCNLQLKALLEGLESAKKKLGSIEFHSTWSCAERHAMYENVQVLLDDVCRIESKCKNLEEATIYLMDKVEETAVKARWELDIFKKSFFLPSGDDAVAVVNELQESPATKILMSMF